MTDDRMALAELIEKRSDGGLLREMFSYVAQRQWRCLHQRAAVPSSLGRGFVLDGHDERRCALGERTRRKQGASRNVHDN